MADKYLDCKHLNCPMPIVEISKAARALNKGQTLEVEANDPAFQADVEAWAAKMGHSIINSEVGDTIKVVIKIES